MSNEARAAALRFVAWARVWSPLASREQRTEAWDALELASSFEEAEPDYWSTFHVGDPLPRIPLVLHAALGMDGGHAREEWMRVLQFLGLRWNEASLPPDHLAPSCEALAAAIDREDQVMVAELCRRYLLPWCQQARNKICGDHEVMREVIECFDLDLRSVESPATP